MNAKTHSLGKTGLQVTPMGLGLAALGRPGYINIGHGEDLAFNYVVEAMERRTHRLLNVAYEHGLRYFDTARSYGRGEQFLMSWLEQTRPKDVVVASKWGYKYTADWEVETDVHEIKDHSPENLREQWAISKKLLPHLRIYQIHSATFETGVLEDKEVLTRMSQLKAEGVKVGLTLSGPRQAEVLRRALEIVVDGVRLFDVTQATFNILEQTAGAVLEEASGEGLGIIVKEALANGRLTMRNSDPEFAKNKQRLEIIGREHGVGMDAIALAFVIAQPWSDVVLSGAAVENHLLSNMDALRLTLGPDTIRDLAAMEMDCEAYWARREQMEWN